MGRIIPSDYRCYCNLFGLPFDLGSAKMLLRAIFVNCDHWSNYILLPLFHNKYFFWDFGTSIKYHLININNEVIWLNYPNQFTEKYKEVLRDLLEIWSYNLSVNQFGRKIIIHLFFLNFKKSFIVERWSNC